MKRCPQCREQFDDQEVFCDQDGTALMDETEFLSDALNRAQPLQQSSSPWITGTIGGLVGVLICVLLYAVLMVPDPDNLHRDEPRNARVQDSTPARSGQSVIPPAPNTSPSENPSPDLDEEQVSASPEEGGDVAPTTNTPTLNNGPIATGTKHVQGAERAIIRMKDGTSVEADAAWEDSQGIWYRRSGLVSFVEKSRVEAITEPSQRQTAKTEVKVP